MKLTRNSGLKFIAALLSILSLTVCAVSLLLSILVFHYRGYEEESTPATVNYALSSADIYNDIYETADYYALVMNGNWWTADLIQDYETQFDPQNTNFFFTITDFDTEEELLRSYSDDYCCYVRQDFYITPAGYSDYYDPSAQLYYDDMGNMTAVAQKDDTATDTPALESTPALHHVMITGYVRADLNQIPADKYAANANLAQFFYDGRMGFIISAAVGAIVSVLLLVFLLYGAGRRKGTAEISLRLADRIPWDLFILLCGGMAALGTVLFFLAFEDTLYGSPDFNEIRIWSCCTLAVAALLIVFLTSFAVRFKVKGWWKNSLIYLLCRTLGEVLHHPLRQLREILAGLPLVWKALLIGAVLVAVEIWCVALAYWGSLFLPIVLWNILVALMVLSAAVQIRRLQLACKAIADGDGDCRVDTRRMYGDFRRQGEDINRIGAGISVAVEARLKSERFKTELITNVSHDLKTPLTSIVNYVDLLSKLALPEEAEGYVEVLRRQSARLKKLTEDLVEASKASTGNLSVEVAPVNLSELLGQVTAEYEERFAAAQLSPVVQLPEEAITALGDGRYLWRVMDNLLSNVCKYALGGTRVYIDAHTQDGAAFISVKNISRDRLNISADELMERFVRGDASRNTEGSGLGLSIAQSLAQLMGGRLSLTVDGDLFKAELMLPLQ